MMTLFGVIQQSKYLLCPPMAYLSFTQNEDSAGSAGGRQAAIDSFLLSKTRPRLRAGNYWHYWHSWVLTLTLLVLLRFCTLSKNKVWDSKFFSPQLDLRHECLNLYH